jgi:hypothetical protein
MIGSLDPDNVLDSMSCEEFDELRAYDKVLPIDHGPKMLGFIAFMLAQQLINDVDQDNLLRSCMPWMEPVKSEPPAGKAALAAVQGGK